MILTVNIGNTHHDYLQLPDGTHLQFSGRLHSSPAAAVDEYAMNLLNPAILISGRLWADRGGILGSVVPALTGGYWVRCGCSALPASDRWPRPEKRHQTAAGQSGPAGRRAAVWGAVAALEEEPGRWRSSRQIPPSPLWQSTANRSWWAVSSCPGRSSPFPRWCKKPPSCPRSTSPLQLPPRSWARIPLPACKTVLCWAPPGCWMGWPSVFRAETWPGYPLLCHRQPAPHHPGACRTPIQYRSI